MTTGVAGLAELWLRFENVLAEQAPGDRGSLRPGASGEDIDRLEAGLGFRLHESVRTTLGLYDGVTARRASTDAGGFLLGYGLLGVDGVLSAHQDLVAMVEDAVEEGEEDLVVGAIADSRWVPLARNVSGDLLFVDHRDDHLGEVGEISFGDPRYALRWPRLDLMLADLCDAVENRTPVTSIARVPVVHEGRMLEWHVRPEPR